MDYQKLFHERKAFERETFAQRMEEFGFKNMARMELFLWDLELFLQIQKILGDRIVLKGGAATQFYLPIEAQRTSVDIDMLFCGTEQEVIDTLKQIETLLGTGDGLMEFRKHTPKNPKTTLPLHTYYVDIPSVLTTVERNVKEEGCPQQELKIEFILQPEKWEFEKRTGENIFAVKSNWEYQLLPLNYLFADKLTTMGCETVGVQNDRMDEQVKQFYDILMLTKYGISEIDCSTVRNKYMDLIKKEWSVRKGTECSAEEVIADVRKQLLRYEMADGGEDIILKKHINDFHSLYLNSKVEYTPQSVACGAALVRLMYELMLKNAGWEKLQQAMRIENKLELSHLSGKEKGIKVREIRDTLIKEFGSYSVILPQILKGKNIKRVFWAVADVDNLDEIEKVLV
ncbi:MAG: nucleotidyl transferase AbiEii/AbiGii toxin family protein [Lachnospiraceae bacterium]|nr:nucleotidyl transferase AbiEii/AbiGii toxin family protein [Lachnospiraceae bacterium]MBP3595477.1 nucleotidyl transferase AbiEii/AbiGii toxin family protein [Lachnospiraceae bacterium]